MVVSAVHTSLLKYGMTEAWSPLMQATECRWLSVTAE